MAVLAIVDDLLFRGKIEAAAAGCPVRFAGGAEPLPAAEPPWTLILVDLNLTSADVLAVIRRAAQAAPAVIGYCSHVQQALQAQALQAGCTRVLPRSAFVQQLPELLRAG